MSAYLVRRLLYMLILLWVITIVAFVIIQLPEGDFVSSYASELARQGEEVNADDLANLRRRFGLDRPMHVQYLLWLGNIVTGDSATRSSSPVRRRQAVRQLRCKGFG